MEFLDAKAWSVYDEIDRTRAKPDGLDRCNVADRFLLSSLEPSSLPGGSCICHAQNSSCDLCTGPTFTAPGRNFGVPFFRGRSELVQNPIEIPSPEQLPPLFSQ